MIVLKFATEIKGDCSVKGHENWITVDSFQWGVGRGISQSGQGKDRDPSTPSFSEVVVTKNMDVASVDLMMQAIAGKSLGDCTIHFIQTGGTDVKEQVYLTVVLKEAIVSAYSLSSAGERPLESISINFNGITQQYDSFGEGKQQTKAKPKGWDLKKNAQI